MLLIAAAVILEMSVWVVVALAILATCFSAFFSPTIGAYLPSLVKDESELGPANSAWSSLDNLAFFIGPAFAALLLSLGTLSLAFVLNALTFGIVALVLLRLPPGRPKPVERDDAEAEGADAAAPKSRQSLRDLLRPMARPLAGLAVVNVADGFVFGGLGVITVILAVDVFQVGEAGTGLLNSAVGVGGIVGALVAGALVLRRRLSVPLLAGALALGLGMALLVGLARELRRLTSQVEELHFLDLAGRLAMRLTRLAQEAQPDASGKISLDWPYTQSDLAAMIGGTRQSVNRLLSELVVEGLIEISPSTLVITDLGELERRAER
jgi:MFS family permease